MRKFSFELDGQKINSEQDFHREISKVLGFPDSYGNNLDALWDILSGHIDTNVRLVWKHHSISKANLGPDFNGILKVFEDLKKCEPYFELVLQ